MFNTKRFQEVSLRHRNQSTKAYHDTQNPGTYYTSSDSGNLYRITMVTVTTTNYQTGEIVTEVKKKIRSINPQVNAKRVSILKENERLERIQYIASHFNSIKTNKFITPEIVNEEGKSCIITTPYIKTML